MISGIHGMAAGKSVPAVPIVICIRWISKGEKMVRTFTGQRILTIPCRKTAMAVIR
jgi:hypothetical protein